MHMRRAGQRSAPPLNCGVMRHKTLAATFMCVVALSSAAQSYQLALPSGKRFVLALANSAEVLSQCSRATPRGATGFWVPTEAQLDQLEAELIKQLVARTGERPPRGVAYH